MWERSKNSAPHYGVICFFSISLCLESQGRVKFPNGTFVSGSLRKPYLAQKALYLGTDTSRCNRPWKNSLEESAIRAGEEHSDSEHTVWSWQGKDVLLKLWDASAVAAAAKWMERKSVVPKNVSHLASRSALWGHFALSCLLQLVNIQPHGNSSAHLSFNRGIVPTPKSRLVTLTVKRFLNTAL